MIKNPGKCLCDPEEKKAQLRIRKLEVAKFVSFAKALAKRWENKDSLDDKDPMEYAIKTRRLRNAVRAHDRTSRVLRGFVPQGACLADMVGFLKRSIVLICTPL